MLAVAILIKSTCLYLGANLAVENQRGGRFLTRETHPTLILQDHCRTMNFERKASGNLEQEKEANHTDSISICSIFYSNFLSSLYKTLKTDPCTKTPGASNRERQHTSSDHVCARCSPWAGSTWPAFWRVENLQRAGQTFLPAPGSPRQFGCPGLLSARQQ